MGQVYWLIQVLLYMEREDKIMKYYVKTDEDSRISLITLIQQDEEQFLFEFPEDFDIIQMIHYKIIDNELIYDEKVFPEIKPQESLEEQITNLQLAICELYEKMGV